MDLVSPILDVVSRLWDCTASRAVHIRRLPQNLKSLETAMGELKNLYKDLKERVEREEKLEKKKRTHVVHAWLCSVEAMGKQVNELLAKGDEEIQKKCLGITSCCCPNNCRASYKLGKIVVEKINDVALKKTEGSNFSVFAEPLPTLPVIERPLNKTVGQDLLFMKVWKWLLDEDDEDGGKRVSSIGLYGMGGVGKTTLLTRINNELLKTKTKTKTRKAEFEAVIWVTVSRPANVEKIQHVLFNKLEISSHIWEGRSEDERAEEIFNVLKMKKSLLLLDDLWEGLDLPRVGIPPPNDQDKFKMVFTTRFQHVCRDLEATKSIEVNCLPWEDAFALFQTKVGADTINSHPHIPKLAEMVAKECDGLPLALITIGRALAGTKTPEEWEKKLQMLKNYPAKFPGIEDVLFSRLAFSYDSLPNEAIKSCFLYCSLFLEDEEIPHKWLIELWIGEGFLDEYDNIQEARNQGEQVIEILQHACLLEKVTPKLDDDDDDDDDDEKTFLKMHDVIRDMALWLARENGRKKNKFVVKDGVGLIRAQEVEEWKDAERIAFWNVTSIEELREPPHFPNTETFLVYYCRIRSFPNGFFTNMSVIKVLNFTGCRLKELPAEIGNLVTLQYLNLSHTLIKRLPMELKNLKKLRCLILNYMILLKQVPSQMLSMLSSLQLFSMYDSYHEGDQNILLEELHQLNYIDDVSISLTSALSTQALIDSHRLRRSIRGLHLRQCESMKLFQLSPHVKTVIIHCCNELEDVEIYLEKEVVAYSKFSSRYQCLNNLCNVSIFGCDKLLNLTWLAYAPKLQFLSVYDCESMEKVIDTGRRSEVLEITTAAAEDHLCVFSRLVSLTLHNLPKLKSIIGHALPFPSLWWIRVRKCPSLKKLPFDSNIGMSKKLEEIKGEQEWWDGLEWDDPTVMHNLTPIFSTYISVM